MLQHQHVTKLATCLPAGLPIARWQTSTAFRGQARQLHWATDSCWLRCQRDCKQDGIWPYDDRAGIFQVILVAGTTRAPIVVGQTIGNAIAGQIDEQQQVQTQAQQSNDGITADALAAQSGGMLTQAGQQDLTDQGFGFVSGDSSSLAGDVQLASLDPNAASSLTYEDRVTAIHIADGDTYDPATGAWFNNGIEQVVVLGGQNAGDHAAATPTSGDMAAQAGPELGSLSMVYETGFLPGQETLAAGRVSSGRHDPGGVSYGAFQLASSVRAGQQVQAFLRTEGSPWAPQFAGMDPTVRGGAFGTTWQQIAAQNGSAFYQAQHAYIQRTHYDPVVQYVLDHTGVDVNTMSSAVQNVVWSMSVQHGGASQLVTGAVNEVAMSGLNPSDPTYQSTLINQLYSDREVYVMDLHPPQPGLIGRYLTEQQAAQQMLVGY